jgi:hypothetical protein
MACVTRWLRPVQGCILRLLGAGAQRKQQIVEGDAHSQPSTPASFSPPCGRGPPASIGMGQNSGALSSCLLHCKNCKKSGGFRIPGPETGPKFAQFWPTRLRPLWVEKPGFLRETGFLAVRQPLAPAILYLRALDSVHPYRILPGVDGGCSQLRRQAAGPAFGEAGAKGDCPLGI